MAAAGVGEYHVNRIESDPVSTAVLMLVCACLTAGRRTRFLLRFGTPRWSVWLSNVLALIASMAAYLLLTLVMSILMGHVALSLQNAGVSQITVYSYATEVAGSELLSTSLTSALNRLPEQLLWVCEWACILYLLGCCLRRHKAITLAVVLGVPAVFFILLLMPMVSETLSALESSGGAASPALFKFILWIGRAMTFIDDQWPQIQLGMALASLPLSYLCMRGTPQPA